EDSKDNLFEAAEAAMAAAEEAVARTEAALESAERSADNSASSLISSQASLLSAETSYCDDFWPDSDAIAFCHNRTAPISAADEAILLEDTTTEEPQRASQAAQLLGSNVSYKNALASKKAADEAVETARADIQAAKEELEEAKKSPTTEEVSRADDAIASAQIGLDLAKIRLVEVEDGPTEDELASEQDNVDSVAVSLELAKIRLAEVEAGPTADELASAQHNVDNAAFSLETAKLKRDEAYTGATTDEIEAQRGQVQLAELALERAQKGLEDALLIAPFDGTVAALNIEVGQAPGPNQTAIILNTPDAVRFDITITESDLADIAVGQVGLAFLDAIGDTPVPIVIDSIGTAPTTTQGVVTFRVEASIFTGPATDIAGAPGGGGGFGGGRFGGGAGQGLFNVAGPSEEFAAFLGIPQAQLESELGSEGATPGSVAEAHGRSRDELSSFLIDQIETSLSEAVEAGTLPQGNVDTLLENLTSNVDAIIDGGALTPGGGGFGQAPVGGGAAGDAEVRPLPGMNASITITIAQSVNVLTVPAQAIQSEGLQSFVEILREDGSTERVEVQIGLSDGINTEITGELEAGDVIVFSGRAATTVQPPVDTAFPGGFGGGGFGGGGGRGGFGGGGGGP
ncbi:MAG: HlyD family efflux transporter periplasmic adaptor subunit, partial [Dehalococcoidia bacterium]